MTTPPIGRIPATEVAVQMPGVAIGIPGQVGPAGPAGPPGPPGPSVTGEWLWTVSTSTVSTGQVGLDTSGWSTATAVHLSSQRSDGTDVNLIISELIIGDTLVVQESADSTVYGQYNVSGMPVLTAGTPGRWVIPVTAVDSGGSPPAAATPTSVLIRNRTNEGPNMRWAGLWNNTTTYVPDDVVERNGSSYITANTTTSVAPPADPWELLASIGGVGPAGPTGPQGIQGVPGPKGDVGSGGGGGAADYVITMISGTCWALGSDTTHSGADAGAVLTWAIGQLGSNGGTICFKGGSFPWQTVPQLPPNLNNWLAIKGESRNSKIVLTTTAPRFLDLGRQAAGDTFRYLHIEGFTIDATPITTPVGHNHVVLGTYAANSTLSGWDVSIDHLIIKNMATLGLHTSTDGTTVAQYNVFLVTYVSAAGLPQRYLTNITVEDCDFSGGTYGVGIYGSKSSLSGWSGEANIWIDNIRIRNIKHDMNTDPTNFTNHAHVHVGGRGCGGTVWIENIWGRGSADVGIEIDGMLDAHVKNAYLRNVFGFVLAITNYQAPPNWQTQVYEISDVTFVRDAGTWSTSSAGMIGILASNDSSLTQQPFGRVRFHNLRMYADGANVPTDIMLHQIQGDILNLKHSPLECFMDGVSYYSSAYQQTNTTTAASPNIFYATTNTGSSQVCKTTIRNVDLTFQGNNASGAAPMNSTGLFISGKHDLLIDNVTCRMNITNPGTFVQMGIKLGKDNGSSIRGTIRGFKMPVNTDTQGRGISVHDSTTLTIPDQILIDDCDFTGMLGTSEIFQANSGDNVSKVFLKNTKWITFPKAPFPITYGTSAAAQQWLGTYPIILAIGGTTISKVEFSRDNVTWYTVTSTAAAAVLSLQHTDWYRITFTTGGIAATAIPII